MRSNDLLSFLFILFPAGVIAAALYGLGETFAATSVFATAFVLASFLAPEIGIYAYFGWQSLDPIVLSTEDALVTPGKIIAVFLLFNYVLARHHQKWPLLLSRRFIVIMVAYLLFGFLLVPVAIVPLIVVRYSAQILVQLMLIAVIIQTLRDRVTIHRALFFLVAGGFVTAGLMLTGSVSGGFRRGTLAEYANPNTTALGLSLAAVCIPAAWGFCKNKVVKAWYLLAGPVILAGTMMTGSRSALLAIVVSSVAGALIVKGAGAWRKIMIAAACGLFAVGTVAYVLKAGFLDETSQQRFLSASEGVRTDSRLYIWKLALGRYVREPWGFGFGNTQYKLAELEGYQVDIHSTVLSILVDGGPIAILLFGWGLFELFRLVRSIGRPNPGISAGILFCFVVVSGLTHTIHFTKWFWLPIAIALLLAEQAERERRAQAPLPVLEEAGVWGDPGRWPAPV